MKQVVAPQLERQHNEAGNLTQGVLIFRVVLRISEVFAASVPTQASDNTPRTLCRGGGGRGGVQR